MRRRLGSGPDISIREVPLVALLPLWLAGVFVVVFVFRTFPVQHWYGADAHAYWMTAQSTDLYGIAPGFRDAFNYSPAFAQAVYPLALLPWAAFFGLWAVMEGTAFAWLLAPLGWRWAVPLWCCCSVEVAFGNIIGMLGVAFVVSLRHPWAWPAVLLTKITPGVGLIWHAVRRDVRGLIIAAGATAVVTAVSYAFAPAHWHEWLSYLTANRGGAIALPLRVGLAAALVAVAAIRPQWWGLLVAAFVLSVPSLNGWLWATALAVVPRMRAVLKPDPRFARRVASPEAVVA